MSLFRTRDWWSTSCGNGDEEFDQGCVCVANIDNAFDNLDKIVVGSYAGVLRVFSPHGIAAQDDQSTEQDGDEAPSRADSLLLEAQLSAPALQVAAGRFVSTSRKLYLAILHPRKLAVYGITAVEGSEVIVDVGAHYQLGLMYEHALQRSAARLVVGPFGGVEGRDFACILSLDGTLSFFEQESFAFSRFLPGAILPGPLAYVPHPADAFVTASSAYLLEVYRYQVLAAATSDADKVDGHNVKTGRKLAMDWFYNLGEAALDISVVTPSAQPSSLIYVLGERHLFCLKDSGALKFMKKMEFSPSCFHIYVHGEPLGLAPWTRVWCFRPDCEPFHADSDGLSRFHVEMGVAVGHDSDRSLQDRFTAQFEIVQITLGLRGAIVSLSDEGKLVCSYLGTNPSIFTPPAFESRDIDYKETDKELAELHRIINASQKSGTLVTRQTEASLSIKVTLTPPKDVPVVSNTSSNSDSDEMRTAASIDLKVKLNTTLPLEGVQVTCHFEHSFTLTPRHFHYGTLSDSTVASFGVQLSEGFVPSTLAGTVAAIYTGVLGGSSCIVRAAINLPINLVLKACQPQKDADFKITMGVLTAIVKLDDLFPEFVDASTKGTNSGQAMGFQYQHDGPIVTILVAKTSQRYRFQSDSFGAMSLLVQEVKSRLESRSSKKGDLQPNCVYSNPLPLSEFFFVVNSHLQIRHKLQTLEKRLSQLAAQFRAIQKRLLSKFKAKTTSPIALDTLLESTYRQIVTTTLSTEECKQNLKTSLCLLTASSRFLCLLLKLYANLKEADYELVTKALCPQLEDEIEQGWEEMVTNNVAYLLATKFKSGGDVASSPITSAQSMSMPTDIGLLRASITRITERLSRGVSIQEEESSSTSNDTFENKGPKDVNLNDEDQHHGLPLGSVFGHKVKAVRFVPPSSPSTINTVDELAVVEKMNQPEVPRINSIKPTSEEVLGEDTILSDIHTVSYDAQSLHEDFY